jgi:RimJ/RimL family protein N-acetyltransferase
VIETDRLLLRKPTAADVEDPPAFLSDPRVMDFLGGVGDPATVYVFVQQWIDSWEKYRFGKLVIETRTGERIGRTGVNFYDPVSWLRSDAPDAQGELTWAIAYEHWGNGYAGEAAVGVRDRFGPGLISLIAPDNARSQRVAEKLGCAPGAVVELPDGGPHVVWTHPR